MITEFQNENRYLSNFYASPFYVEGVEFKTAEHYYQTAKAKSRPDKFSIILSETPHDAKRLGFKVEAIDDWELAKKGVMRMAVLLKFTQNIGLLEKLIGTGDQELIEGNHWHDNFWGQCSCEACEGEGLNNLGEILMETRDNLREMLYAL